MATEAAVVLSTRDVPTGLDRENQPQAALTPAQKDHIDTTWALVEESGLLENGMQLFKHIFTICPEAREMFQKMKDVPFSELEANEVFRAHSLQVMEAIALAVSMLITDEEADLHGVLLDLGMSHGQQGLQDAHFDLVGKALLITLEEGLGDKFTKDVKDAYIAFYTVVTKGMKEGLAEYTPSE